MRVMAVCLCTSKDRTQLIFLHRFQLSLYILKESGTRKSIPSNKFSSVFMAKTMAQVTTHISFHLYVKLFL